MTFNDVYTWEIHLCQIIAAFLKQQQLSLFPSVIAVS